MPTTAETSSVIRQCRFKPAEWARVQEQAKSLGIPAARYIVYATMRSLGTPDEIAALNADLAALREIQARFSGVRP